MTSMKTEHVTKTITPMTTIFTEEQRETIDLYFKSHATESGVTQFTMRDADRIGFVYVSFFSDNITVSRDTSVVLEIKVKDTVITMWKNVMNISITIL
jgi:hypothetical protein